MNKGKTVLVTVILAALVAVIDVGLYLLTSPGFTVLTGAFALYGFFRGAGDFRRWLYADKPVTVAPPFDLQQERMRRKFNIVGGTKL